MDGVLWPSIAGIVNMNLVRADTDRALTIASIVFPSFSSNIAGTFFYDVRSPLGPKSQIISIVATARLRGHPAQSKAVLAALRPED